MTIVLVVVLVIVVAGVGTYVFVFSSSSGSGPTTTTSTSHTLTISTPTSGATSTSSAASTETTSSVTGLQSYKGNFTYIVPLGPFGINDSSGKPVEWNSTQTASGTFTFSVNPSTYLGSGSGQGSITVATRGYCTGSETVPYTFTVTATHPPGEDLEVAFDPPSPANVTVQLTCQGSTVGFNTANNPVTFLSVYPNLVTTASVPMTDSQVLTGGISYTVIIVATS